MTTKQLETVLEDSAASALIVRLNSGDKLYFDLSGAAHWQVIEAVIGVIERGSRELELRETDTVFAKLLLSDCAGSPSR